MLLRVFTFLIVVIVCTSCNQFMRFDSSEKQMLDTIVDFSVVDFSPSFKNCDSLLARQQKSDCFRQTIYSKMAADFQQYTFHVKDSVAETIYVNLQINTNGSVVLDTIESSEIIKTALPTLDSLLQVSIEKLPQLYPAIKRGIPVTTTYRLPILIELKE